MTTQQALPQLLFGTTVLLCRGKAPTAAPGAPPAADEAGLSYSTDGMNYSTSPPPILPTMPRFIPGNEVHARLWIHNARHETVDISVQPSRPDVSGVMLAATYSGTTRLNAGASTAISGRASLPVKATDRTQNQTSENMRLLVNARTAVPEALTPQTPDVPPGELSETGFSGGILPLILGMLGGGGVLYTMSRRQLKQEHKTKGHRP